jgi:predicted transcriptional regulator
LPETGIDQINEEATPAQTDVLSSHLLSGKKKHDEDKNVETEEVQHLDKGIDYLTTMLLQQGVKETKTKSKKTPPKLDELKKLFVQELIDSGYVKIGDKGRTILTDTGKEFLDNQTIFSIHPTLAVFFLI